MTYLTPKQREQLAASPSAQNEMTLAEYQARFKPPKIGKDGQPKAAKPRKPKVVVTLYEGACPITQATYLIGIDPDVKESGIANWQRARPGFFPLLDTQKFFDLIAYVDAACPVHMTYIRMSAGWLNPKTNFHRKAGAGPREKQSAAIGANHEVGKKLVEYFVSKGYTVELVRPKPATKKNPNGGKWSAETFKQITGLSYGYNSEIRDAAQLVYNE